MRDTPEVVLFKFSLTKNTTKLERKIRAKRNSLNKQITTVASKELKDIDTKKSK